MKHGKNGLIRYRERLKVAFTPKGGCPLKLFPSNAPQGAMYILVAFTPKGGCPLKLCVPTGTDNRSDS